MDEEALEKVISRNNFYRDNYRRVVLGLLVLVAINAGLIAVVAYQLTHRPEPKYFATTKDGRIIRLHPLTAPVLAQEAVSQYAVRGVLKAYSFNFAHYKQDLEQASRYFSSQGWQKFKSSLKEAGMLDLVINKRLVANAVTTGAPTLLKKGVINGRYTWQFQIPILVTYESASETLRQALTVTVMIQRVSIINHPKQIAVTQFVASEEPIQR
jgi:intracellular multiplication protein IcmL